jgi:hypothetical protein
MFSHQTLDTCLSRIICIPHEFVSTRYGMIQFHLDFDTRRYTVMSYVRTKHSICIVMKCISVSALNTRCLFVPHVIIPHEFVTTRYGMIKFHHETICCHVICLHETLDMYSNDMYPCFRTKHSIRICPV